MEIATFFIVVLLLCGVSSKIAIPPGDSSDSDDRLTSSVEYRDWCVNPDCHDLHSIDETETEANKATLRFIHCSPLFESLVYKIGEIYEKLPTESVRELPFSVYFCHGFSSSSESDSDWQDTQQSTTSQQPTNNNSNRSIFSKFDCSLNPERCRNNKNVTKLYWILAVASLILIILFSIAVNIWLYFAKKRGDMDYKNFGREETTMTDLQFSRR